MLGTPSVRLEWSGKTAPRVPPTARLSAPSETAPGSLLIRGDNLAALHALARESEPSVALAYLDPPFFTGRKHLRVTRKRGADGAIVRSHSEGFDDRWASLEEYLQALADRIAAARALLSPDGCLVLHVDPKTSHYAKVLCDEIFGSGSFASEIVWRYRRWPSKTPNFQRVHDVLLRYVRNPAVRPRFRQLYEPLAASTLATWGAQKQRAVVGADGRRQRSSTTKESTPGAPLGDVWDIGIVAPISRERTGYPTQKPEQLLERLILSCTLEGDLVLDPYCGSGTTLAVCARLGRRAVGIDESPNAVAVAERRLREQGVEPSARQVLPKAARPASTRARGSRATRAA